MSARLEIVDHVARVTIDRPEVLNALDADAALYRLDHVVDRQTRDRHGGQRLHLDTGRAGDLHRGAHNAAGEVFVGRDVQRDFRQGQRMTQRDQFRRPFRRHDAGDARGAEYVALFRIA